MMSRDHVVMYREEISKSNRTGNMVFSNRDDYAAYFLAHGLAASQKDVWANDDLIIAAQRHWHAQGQNGCAFAQVAATRAKKYGWQSKVVRDGASPSGHVGHAIDQIFEKAMKDRSCENLSLLFPSVDTPGKLIALLLDIRNTSSLVRVISSEHEDASIIALRGLLDTNKVLSWVVGFGPFDFLPQTRQAPFTELAIRTKKKPEVIFDKLNQDRDAAHLADLPLGLEYGVMDRLLDRTKARTHDILGASSRRFSSAKVTFAIPSYLFNTILFISLENVSVH